MKYKVGDLVRVHFDSADWVVPGSILQVVKVFDDDVYLRGRILFGQCTIEGLNVSEHTFVMDITQDTLELINNEDTNND
jgi:hypothetical protein